MKKYFMLIIVIFGSCSLYKKDKFEYRNNDKNVWKNTFKSEVFYSCINEGLKNDSLYKILKNKDFLNIYDGFDISIIDKARNIGKTVMMKIPKPYLKIDNDEIKLKNKNFISYTCLCYFASKELDSIAKIEYKNTR